MIAGLLLCVLLPWIDPVTGDENGPFDDGGVDFDRDVRPLLADRCYACHGPDSSTRAAGLRLDQRRDALSSERGRPAIVPGSAQDSELVARVFADDPRLRMPPVSSGLELSAGEKETLRRWIQTGAEWREHWAFVPPQRPDVPSADGASHPIDAFVRARLHSEGLAQSPPASKTELIRRLTLDLTGLPPTLDDVDAFLRDDSPTAYETVVDRLLEAPAYGEHMALTWLDAARYADTNGYQGDLVRSSWPWRDWVIRALNDNMPFDQFTVEQLAGDLLPNATVEQRVATGFHRNHMLNGEGGRIAEESRVDYVIDRVNTTGTVWLGLTLGCAQCHDHKYDPISHREYYRLFAYFNQVDESGGVDAGGNAHPILRVPTAQQTAELAALDARQRELEHARDTGLVPAPDDQRRWEVETLRALHEDAGTATWTPLAPTRVTATHDVTLTQLDDGSTFVSGANPPTNDYVFEARLPPGRWTGLRLEALTHESFTNGYLARSNSGNFVLTEMTVTLRGAADNEPITVQMASAVADFTQGGFDIRHTFDGNSDTGWAVHGDNAFRPHLAAYRFAEPQISAAGAVLAVRLEHRSRHAHHNLGRFRLSVTEVPEPGLDGTTALPPAVIDALAIEPSDRDAAQAQAIADAHRSTLRPDPAIVAELASIDKRRSQVEAGVVSTMVMRDRESPRATHRLIRGVYNQPDTSETLTPGVPTVLPPLTEGATPNRLALARWLVAPEHPLTARVTVNRIWQSLFGTGLVRTSEDFGVQGEKPSHPLLLDWLATEFVASGWDVKALHRALVLSETYRQSSRVDPELWERDPDNRLLARAPRRRLSSFALRDQALALSGLLVQQLGGPSVKPYQPPGVWEEATFGQIKFEQDHGEKLYRRSLYTFWRRIVGPTGFFDTASRQACSVRKERTNTPLHALVTLNDVTFVEAARVFASGLVTRYVEPRARVREAFRRATARLPSASEEAILLETLEDACRWFSDQPEAAAALTSIGEWPLNDRTNVVDLAATTQLCLMVLNLDEVLCRN